MLLDPDPIHIDMRFGSDSKCVMKPGFDPYAMESGFECSNDF